MLDKSDRNLGNLAMLVANVLAAYAASSAKIFLEEWSQGEVFAGALCATLLMWYRLYLNVHVCSSAVYRTCHITTRIAVLLFWGEPSAKTTSDIAAGRGITDR
jgi:hypothetical protein